MSWAQQELCTTQLLSQPCSPASSAEAKGRSQKPLAQAVPSAARYSGSAVCSQHRGVVAELQRSGPSAHTPARTSGIPQGSGRLALCGEDTGTDAGFPQRSLLQGNSGVPEGTHQVWGSLEEEESCCKTREQRG